MTFKLLRDEAIRCKGSNVMLLEIGVTRQLNDLHPVLERGRYGNTGVSSSNEHHVGEIKSNIHVMIAEGGILFWIENFKEGRGGIASEIRTEFINLIK